MSGKRGAAGQHHKRPEDPGAHCGTPRRGRPPPELPGTNGQALPQTHSIRKACFSKCPTWPQCARRFGGHCVILTETRTHRLLGEGQQRTGFPHCTRWACSHRWWPASGSGASSPVSPRPEATQDAMLSLLPRSRLRRKPIPLLLVHAQRVCTGARTCMCMFGELRQLEEKFS